MRFIRTAQRSTGPFVTRCGPVAALRVGLQDRPRNEQRRIAQGFSGGLQPHPPDHLPTFVAHSTIPFPRARGKARMGVLPRPPVTNMGGILAL